MITGGVRSETRTVLVSGIARFPELSTAQYVIRYVPEREVFTVPDLVTVQVKLVSARHVAPGSVNTLPRAIFIVDAPERVITGFERFDEIPRERNILSRFNDTHIGAVVVMVSPFFERISLT